MNKWYRNIFNVNFKLLLVRICMPFVFVFPEFNRLFHMIRHQRSIAGKANVREHTKFKETVIVSWSFLWQSSIHYTRMSHNCSFLDFSGTFLSCSEMASTLYFYFFLVQENWPLLDHFQDRMIFSNFDFSKKNLRV